MRNYLFRGSPGTGKTYLARAAAYYLCHEGLAIADVFNKDIAADSRRIEQFIQGPCCEYIQVHAAMGYEDIVHGPDIRAAGELVVHYAQKRIMALCDRAAASGRLCCVILDDISRTNAGALLGNLLYAMEYRNTAVALGNGDVLSVPENVVFLFTECLHPQSEGLDYALRRRMDYVAELTPDKALLERHYAAALSEEETALVLSLFTSTCRHIDRTILPEYKDRAAAFYPGHGMFLVEARGTPYHILDKLRQKLIYQLFPHLRELRANGILGGDGEAFCESIKARLNTGIAGLNRIVSVKKILANAGREVSPYHLADTRDYYDSTIIPGHCSDYKGLLESVIDAIVLNGIFTHDIAFPALLQNTQIAAIPSKAANGTFASYLVPAHKAQEYYYETPRNGQRVPHQYYSTNRAKVGRWAAARDAAAYQVTYRDQGRTEIFLPLNGVRLHTFTTGNVCKANNPAEIYGALYRLIDSYLRSYAENIGLIKGSDGAYQDLYDYITLELQLLAALNRRLDSITAGSPTARENARIDYFGSKLRLLNTLWNPCGSEIVVSADKFQALVQGTVPLTAASFEDMFSHTPATAKTIRLEGVVKMTDLHDYQAIMENIGVRQMVFQGPPGTSKTFESQKFVLKQLEPHSPVLANAHLTQEDISQALASYKLTDADYRDPEHSQKLESGGWDLVQFHPSYGYEDFIRGIEVQTNHGVPAYATVNRILGKIAEFAKLAEQADPQHPPKFYLLIDEINRANLATVFGELIYGLEYRNSRVSTPYEVNDRAEGSPTKDIVLGKNLFLIGTMNTADKSIDAIDYAIRRRFLFIDSPADRNVVISCYQSISGNQDENAIELLLFDAVQSLFNGDRFFNPDYQRNDVRLGHTYFLRKKQTGYLDDAIEHFVFQIIPILREYGKDGILDSSEDLLQLEHSVEEIHSAADADTRNQLIGDNIMVYTKEFGSMGKFGQVIDNTYIGAFIERLAARLGC